MKKRTFFDFFATALTFVFALISLGVAEVSFVDSSAELSATDEGELISNPDFSVCSVGIFGNTADSWNTGEFGYDNASKCISAAKAGCTAMTDKSIAFCDGVYVMSAEAEALNGDAKISLFIGESDKTESNFTITGRQTVSFYFLENVGYSAQAGVKVTELSGGGSLKVYSVSLKKAGGSSSVETENGASIRANSSEPGLRFKGRVNKSVYDGLTKFYGAENVETGMIIVPEDFLEGGTDFTAEALKERSPLFIVAEKFNNETRAEEDGYYGFNCALIEIAPENTDRKFAARAYIKCFDGATEKYVYATYNKDNHCRSVYEVATAAEKNLSEEDDNFEVEAIIDEYLGKVEYFDLKGGNFTQSGNEFFINLGTKKGMLTITSDYSDEGQFIIAENGKEILPDNGYYFTEGTGNLTISFVFNSRGLNFMQDVSLKIYKY